MSDSVKGVLIIDIFQHLKEFVNGLEGRVDMMDADLIPNSRLNKCGNVACVGGWIEAYFRDEVDLRYAFLTDYLSGICILKKLLECEFPLNMTGRKESKWWPYSCGSVFASEEAYGKTRDQGVTIDEVCDTWIEYGARMAESEEESNE